MLIIVLWIKEKCLVIVQLTIIQLITINYNHWQQTGNKTHYKLMKAAIVTKKNKRDKHIKSDSSIKMREKAFNTRHELAQKCPTYDALDDPHAEYFFTNKSVRHHLKFLKKAIKNQAKQGETLRITQLIDRRLSEKYEKWLHPKTKVYQQQNKSMGMSQLGRLAKSTLQSKTLNNTLTKHRTRTKRKSSKTYNFPTGFELIDNQQSHQMITRPKQLPLVKSLSLKTKDQSRYADRLFDSLHQRKRSKWISFLEEKMKKLVDNAEEGQS